MKLGIFYKDLIQNHINPKLKEYNNKKKYINNKKKIIINNLSLDFPLEHKLNYIDGKLGKFININIIY